MKAKLQRELLNFAPPILKELEGMGLLKFVKQFDHACYRVSDLETYEALKNELRKFAKLLSEALINGRPIATFKLHEPIALTPDVSIALIELPAPRPGTDYPLGFEHIEAVIDRPLDEFLASNPDTEFELKNARAAVNPDVSWLTAQGLVKFHEASLEDVILQEQEAIRSQAIAKIVLIDFDDTLVQSRVPFLRAVQTALESHLDRELTFQEVAEGARPTFPEFFANFGIVESSEVLAVVERFQVVWPSFLPDCKIQAGIHSLLSCLQCEGIKVFIWSARDMKTLREFVDIHDLGGLVDDYFAYDGHSHSKPFPSERLVQACAAARCVMIGDSRSDFDGARRLGIPFVQAVWYHRAPLEVPPETIVSSPVEALNSAVRILKNGA